MFATCAGDGILPLKDDEILLRVFMERFFPLRTRDCFFLVDAETGVRRRVSQLFLMLARHCSLFLNWRFRPTWEADCFALVLRDAVLPFIGAAAKGQMLYPIVFLRH